jgi:hypothetical protein
MRQPLRCHILRVAALPSAGRGPPLGAGRIVARCRYTRSYALSCPSPQHSALSTQTDAASAALSFYGADERGDGVAHVYFRAISSASSWRKP